MAPSQVFRQIKVIKKYKDDAQRAEELLRRIADEVTPIMVKHKWKCASLEEPGLYGLNVNRRTIKVRMRKPGSPKTFLDYHVILDTLLHEMVHLKISPHNAAFYDLWNELRVEFEELQTRGTIKGETKHSILNPPFTGSGYRLSASSAANSSPSQLRRLAAEAAQRRAISQSRAGSGGKVLGGHHPSDGLSIREKLRLAAESRMGGSSGTGCVTVCDGHNTSNLEVDSIPVGNKSQASNGSASTSTVHHRSKSHIASPKLSQGSSFNKDTSHSTRHMSQQKAESPIGNAATSGSIKKPQARNTTIDLVDSPAVKNASVECSSRIPQSSHTPLSVASQNDTISDTSSSGNMSGIQTVSRKSEPPSKVRGSQTVPGQGDSPSKVRGSQTVPGQSESPSKVRGSQTVPGHSESPSKVRDNQTMSESATPSSNIRTIETCGTNQTVIDLTSPIKEHIDFEFPTDKGSANCCACCSSVFQHRVAGSQSNNVEALCGKCAARYTNPEGNIHTKRIKVEQAWVCALCTLINRATFLQCDACGEPRSRRW